MSTKKVVADVATALTDARLESKRKTMTTAYQKALGRLTIEFSFLHFSLERFSWKLWNLTGPSAQILTKDLQLKQLAIKLRASAEHAIRARDERNDFVSILKRVENVAEQRNEFYIRCGSSLKMVNR